MRIAPEGVALAGKAAPKLAKLKQATQDFEAVLLKRMVTSMRKSVPDVKVGDTLGGDMYKDMLDDVLAKTLAEGKGIGLAKTLYDRMAPEVLRQEKVSTEQRGPRGASELQSGSGPVPGQQS